MERFDDPDLSDDEDDPNPGHLNQEATEESNSILKVTKSRNP